MKDISCNSTTIKSVKNIAVLGFYMCAVASLASCASQGNESAFERSSNNSTTTTQLATAAKPVTTTTTTSSDGLSTVTQDHLPTAYANGYTTTTTTQASGHQ